MHVRLVRACSLAILCTFAACSSSSSNKPQQSSFDHIDAAEASGMIDPDTALLYRLYATYDPSLLPSSVRGDDKDVVREGTVLFLHIEQRFDQMAEPTKSKIEPFLRMPDDPTSFWATLFPSPTGLRPQSDPAPQETWDS